MAADKRAVKRPSSLLAGLLLILGVVTMLVGVLGALQSFPRNLADGFEIAVAGMLVAGLGSLISWQVEAVYELRLARAQLHELQAPPTPSDQRSPARSEA